MDTTQSTQNYRTVDPSEFAEVVKSPDVFEIDVRPAEMFEEGHIAGAHNMPLGNPDFLENAKKNLPAGKTIAVNCLTGMHSAIASDELSKAGYNVVNLNGGLNAWEAAGLPVVK